MMNPFMVFYVLYFIQNTVNDYNSVNKLLTELQCNINEVR